MSSSCCNRLRPMVDIDFTSLYVLMTGFFEFVSQHAMVSAPTEPSLLSQVTSPLVRLSFPLRRSIVATGGNGVGWYRRGPNNTCITHKSV